MNSGCSGRSFSVVAERRSAEQIAADADNPDRERNLQPGTFHRLFDDGDGAAAAGDLHPRDGDRPDPVAAEDLRKFLHVLFGAVVQLRAEDDEDSPVEQLPVEPPECVGDAVGRDQQIGFIEVFRGGIQKLELNRPLPQGGGARRRRSGI